MSEEKILLNAVLCFPVRGDEALLALKMEKIGAGCRNGYGGGIEAGETPLQALVREVGEEGLVMTSPSDYTKIAVVDFHNTTAAGKTFVCRVHAYFLHRWDGEFQPTKEMSDPRWYQRDQLPLDQMMLADRIWVPKVMAGKKIIGHASYGPHQQTLLGEMKIDYVDELSDAA